MRKVAFYFSSSLLLLSLILVSCQEPEKESKKALVYEGMSSKDLKGVLGEPDSIHSKQGIFDASTMKKIPVEEWSYKKRLVLLINDTVKNPNLN